ncbi:MAG: hypothetical protein ACYC2H_00470 [Thermoplasmatota archaeon]
MRRVAIGIAVLLGLSAAPTQALYEDMTFTPVITDGAGDAAGFNDIVEFALGEPGDGTIVVRIKPAAFSPAPPAAAASIDYFVGDLRISVRPDATHTAEYSSCTIDGAFAYCILPYDALDLEVGDDVPAANAISYFGSAIDCAPDTTPGTACALTVGAGSAYTLVGCTTTSCPDDGAGPTIPTIQFSNVTTPELGIHQSFSSATNDTYQFNWTSSLSAAELELEVQAVSGNATLTIVDGSGSTLVNKTYLEGDTVAQDLADAAGNWTVRLAYTAFVGNVSLSIRGASAPITNTTTSQTSTTEASGSFPLVYEKDTPMPGTVPLVMALLAVALLVVRRRLP